MEKNMVTYRYMLTIIDTNRNAFEFKVGTKNSLNKQLTHWIDLGYTVQARKLTQAEKEKFNKHLDKRKR